MPRSSETPPSGRALLVTGLRRCDGITRGCPYQATSQHHGKEQQTSIEAPAARHSGAGRNPETTRDIATPAQTGTPRPKPHQTLHWVPACAGTTVSNECALSGGRAAPTVDHRHRHREPHTAVIPAKAGIQKPRPPQHHPPRQASRVRSPIKRPTTCRPAPVRRIERGRAFRGLPAAAPHCEATHPANTCSVSSSASSPRKPPLWCAHSRA